MSKNTYYPISLNLSGKRCVVIGGGSVAARKVSGLLKADAEVSVVSPILNSDLEKLVDNNRVKWIEDEYQSDYLDGATLVFGATDSPEVNSRISEDAKAAGIPVNIADDPENCTFILPAICKRDDIQIAVSTSGAAPGIAAHIRDKIDSFIGHEYEILVSTLKMLRSRIKGIQQKEREHFWQRVKKLDVASYREKANELADLLTSWVDEAEKNDETR
jgi:precorrin-2 dehydrogenase/sirohydrochlorin ferrochelatase